jgi:DHA2 family multidrug resistance protein
VLATVMPAIDTTIANVALPSMGGSMSASAEQITWVLTSYIVGVALMTPISGWLALKFGRKRVFLVSVIGFTVASGLCGAAQNLWEVILLRALQGAIGAPIAPLSQAVILDTFEPEERGPALAVWSMGMMAAPILGPVLGGYLTDTFDWRWVFYINLPVGIVATMGVIAFIPDNESDARARFDFFGFALLGLFVVCLQLMLDRGQANDWLDSQEIVVYAVLAAMALYMFAVHILTARQTFLPVAMFRDRNFVTTTALQMLMGVSTFSAMALTPPLMQTLMGYPVEAAGWALAPRGVSSLLSSYIAGRMVGKIDDRLLILFGLCMFALSFWQMSGSAPDMDDRIIIISGLVLGFGSGFIFIPLTTLGYATLAPQLRAQATSFSSLLRNMGSSIGISILFAYYARQAQTMHAHLADYAAQDNPLMRSTTLIPWYDLTATGGLAALNAEVSRQASMSAYAQCFHLLFILSLAMTPLLLLLRRPGRTVI